jgi:hypothetical protein
MRFKRKNNYGRKNMCWQVPPEWKLFVEDLDKEREMWLNSFTKTPFTIPMPPELEYWWSEGEMN